MRYIWEENDIKAGVQAKVLVSATSDGMQIVTVVMRAREDLDAYFLDNHRPFRLLTGMNMAASVPYTALEIAANFTRVNAEPVHERQFPH